MSTALPPTFVPSVPPTTRGHNGAVPPLSSLSATDPRADGFVPVAGTGAAAGAPSASSHGGAAAMAVSNKLREAQDMFIRRWGEMGQTWGINRTMAEIHALLFITAQPLCTDDVMERLNISRGNASM